MNVCLLTFSLWSHKYAILLPHAIFIIVNLQEDFSRIQPHKPIRGVRGHPGDHHQDDAASLRCPGVHGVGRLQFPLRPGCCGQHRADSTGRSSHRSNRCGNRNNDNNSFQVRMSASQVVFPLYQRLTCNLLDTAGFIRRRERESKRHTQGGGKVLSYNLQVMTALLLLFYFQFENK